MNYPDPCIACKRVGQKCTYQKCTAWKTRYIYRQKQINAFARRPVRLAAVDGRRVFRYEHPDIIREYLAHGPCRHCKAAEVCGTPCPAYWSWWDARMEWMRGLIQKGKRNVYDI